MVNTTDPWHYPRPELADNYIQLFKLGLTSAKGLFAKRRMGKTEFLKNDLIPAAHKAGYNVAYVNLWENSITPATALLGAIQLALKPTGFGRIKKRLNTPVKKLKASGKIAGIEAGVEAEMNSESRSGEALSNAVLAIDAASRPLLLVIDEAQILAGANHASFAKALRAVMDVRKERIKVIFAGSSEATLRRMFGKFDEPFYNWSELEPFELLGRDFVEFMVERVNEISKYPIRLVDALQAFNSLKDTPEFFRRYLERYVTYPKLGPDEALNHTKTRILEDGNFRTQWESLLPTDQQMLIMLSHGESCFHGKPARERLGLALGLGGPTTSNAPQQSLARLQKLNIIVKLDHGLYRFEDDVFAEWINMSVSD